MYELTFATHCTPALRLVRFACLFKCECYVAITTKFPDPQPCRILWRRPFAYLENFIVLEIKTSKRAHAIQVVATYTQACVRTPLFHVGGATFSL
jgi:hypothetical protein